MITLYLHIEGLETSVVEVEEMPAKTDTVIVGYNARRRDNKELPYLLKDVTTMIIPMTRIVFIEVLSDDKDDEFETFIRE